MHTNFKAAASQAHNSFSQIHKARLGQTLGEQVCQLPFARNPLDVQVLGFDHLAHEVIPNINMLRAVPNAELTVGECACCLVVRVKHGRLFYSYPELFTTLLRTGS